MTAILETIPVNFLTFYDLKVTTIYGMYFPLLKEHFKIYAQALMLSFLTRH